MKWPGYKLQPHKHPHRLPPPPGHHHSIAREDRAGYLSAEPLMSRRQVSICTSRPRFMLHISMYSCRCRFMSFLAVANSSCGGGWGQGRRVSRAPAPRRLTCRGHPGQGRRQPWGRAQI